MTYAISFPRLTFIVYELGLFLVLTKGFLGEHSPTFNLNLNTMVTNPENLNELMRINMQDILDQHH